MSTDPFDIVFNDLVVSFAEDSLTSQLIAKIRNQYEEEIASSSRATRKKRSYQDRGREEGDSRLYNDYFSDNPVYNEVQFRRRFRMRKSLFIRIKDALENRYPYFQESRDAVGRKSLSPLQKCTAAMRMLAYGVAADAVDDYVRIGETTSLQCLKKFALGVIEIFEQEYLRSPTEDDLRRLLDIGERRGFPGMLGSIDCMHWQTKNCPSAWQGMFTGGHKGKPTIILEAIASYDLWIWHAFFGVVGSNNDINVFGPFTGI